ncbi:MAG: HD-GYP domain-containing protein [Phycisphaerales bacterium]|nr:HD-GYP domain-containing protein [Phycisphaerales bacterium]
MSILSTIKARAQVSTLQQRLREIGLVLMQCDRDGHYSPRRTDRRDWLGDLVHRSPLVTRGLGRAAAKWNAEDQPMPYEVVPGLWLAAVPVQERRERTGYVIAAIPTCSLVESEQFNAMCQAARLDVVMARRMLEGLKPPSSAEVPRLAAMFRFSWHDQMVIDSHSSSLEGVGRELGESYEEINLLYTIIQGMTVVERPDRFVSFACDELLQTLPYRWIAAWVEPRRPGGQPEMLVAGTPGRSEALIKDAAAAMSATLDPGASCVVDGHPAAGSILAEFGTAAMAQPISRDGRMHGILIAGEKEGADITASSVDMKLLGAAASHMAIFLENAGLYDDLNAMFLGTLEALTASIDAKDRYTCGHSRRVALLTRQLAHAAGLDEATVARMHIAGLVHDVGKIGVSEQLLCKPGELTEDEYALIREHPRIGYRILRDIPRFEDILDGVLHHHERWDGAGYPDGIAGEDIPLVARLIALADAFDAMGSTRTYRSAMDCDAVLAELARGAGKQFDPNLVPLFLELDFTGYQRMVEGHQPVDHEEMTAEAMMKDDVR